MSAAVLDRRTDDELVQAFLEAAAASGSDLDEAQS